MTEQQKKIIKEAIEKATKAWTALGEASETLERVREGIELKDYDNMVGLFMTVDDFWSEQRNVELRIAYLERLVRE